jgi:hypothetical protein
VADNFFVSARRRQSKHGRGRNKKYVFVCSSAIFALSKSLADPRRKAGGAFPHEHAPQTSIFRLNFGRLRHKVVSRSTVTAAGAMHWMHRERCGTSPFRRTCIVVDR